MIKNNRIDIIRGTVLDYIDIYRHQNNIYHVEITSAAPLDDASRARLTKMIERNIEPGATAEYTYKVNPDLIGGFTVTINNRRLDASVSNELKQLRLSLIN